MSGSETKAPWTRKRKTIWIAVAVVVAAAITGAIVFFATGHGRTADDAFREAENGRATVSFTPADRPYYYIFTTCQRNGNQLSDTRSARWQEFANGVKQLAETDKSNPPVSLLPSHIGLPDSPQTVVNITIRLAGTTPIDKARSHALAVLDFLDRLQPCNS